MSNESHLYQQDGGAYEDPMKEDRGFPRKKSKKDKKPKKRKVDENGNPIKKKKKKSREDMDASKNKNTVSKKKSGKKDDGEPVRRSRRIRKWRFHFCLQQIEARLIAHMESAEVEDIDSQEYEFEFGQLVHLW